MALNDNDLLFINDSTDSNKGKSVKLKTLKENILTGGTSDTYVEVAGDHMTGTLTLGNTSAAPNISLNADGSSSFAKSLKVANTNIYSEFSKNIFYSSAGGDEFWYKDSIQLGGDTELLADAPKINLSATDGTGTFKGRGIFGSDSLTLTCVAAEATTGDSLYYGINRGSGDLIDLRNSSGSKFSVSNNGSGTFAENILVGNDISIGTGCQMVRQGQIIVRRDDSSKNLFEAFSGGSATSNRVIQLGADGSATFFNSVTSGDTSKGCQLFNNGSAIGRVGGAQKWYLNNDGSADFSGTVKAAGYSMASLAQL